jgi:integrase
MSDKVSYQSPELTDTAVTVWALSEWIAITSDDSSQLPAPRRMTVMPTGPDFTLPLGVLVHTAVTAASRSEHTRRSYKTGLGQFFAYLGAALGTDRPLAQPGKNGRATVWAFRGTAEIVTHISPSLVDGFRAWLDEAGLSTNAVENRVSAVRTFLAVCYRDGYLSDDQARRLDVRPFKSRTRRDSKPVGRRLGRAEVRKLRAAVNTGTLKGRRDLAIIDCMLFAGLRREEVGGLRVGDLQQDGGRYWLIVSGKGRKTRRLKVADPLYRSLVAWIDAAGKTLAHASPIFEGMNRHGRLTGMAVTGSTVGRLVAEYGTAAGLAPPDGVGRLSPHDLRRTAARNAHDNGAPLLMIQRFLGHTDPKTTARYIGLGEDDSDTAADYIRY